MATVDTGRIDEVLRRAVDSGAVPKVVALAADADGPFDEGAVGHRTAGTDQPLDGGTHFRIASMTKMVATVAALQLVERGELDLQTPVDALVPQWAELQVLEGWDGDTPRLRPPATRATVHHLVTHTSGLGYWFWNEDLVRYESVTGTPNVMSAAERRSAPRWSPTPAPASSTASTPTGWAWWSRRSAAARWTSTWRRTSSPRSAWPRPASPRPRSSGRTWCRCTSRARTGAGPPPTSTGPRTPSGGPAGTGSTPPRGTTCGSSACCSAKGRSSAAASR